MSSTEERDRDALVDGLSFAAKVDRAVGLLEAARDAHGPGLVVAHSLGKDSCVVWDLAMRVDPGLRGFIVTTRYKPPETLAFMAAVVARYPRLAVYHSDATVPANFPATDPDRCCELLKVEPTRRALAELGASCWVTGLRCTEGRTRVDYREVEERDPGLVKLNPILIWHEREVWQYLALRQVPVNPLYGAGYRSLGCAPCTRVATGPDERAGRWQGTSKCGGECGIHTRPLKDRALRPAG
jgi:phosphoadenosine phosphosulfate reductase